MTIFRVAILAGVSSDSQAEEGKKSIPDQIEKCRAFIDRTPGAYEAAGPFVMDGYSRTGYDSLEIAMRDIPPLADAILSAEKNKYDVLVLDNFDRLGDLGQIMLVRFNRYKKQLHSIRQSGQLYDPAQYDPTDNEFSTVAMAYEQMIQSYRLKKLRRGWKIGVPARVEQGLPANRVPLGYTLVDKKTPPVINENAELVLEMKDLYLAGVSLSEISRRMRAKSDASRFNPGGIRITLLNPFYAGYNTLFKETVTEKGTKLARPKSEWLVRPGLHKPLWDDATHNALWAEYERRCHLHVRNDVIYPLRSLLKCSKCGAVMGHLNLDGEEWLACPKSHLSLRYREAVEMLADRLRRDMEHRRLHPPDRSSEIASIQAVIAQARARRQKVQEGFEAELYTAKEASNRITEIEAEIARAERRLEKTRSDAAMLENADALLSRMDLSHLADWMQDQDPAKVNKLLSGVIKSGTVHRGRTKWIKYLELEYW